MPRKDNPKATLGCGVCSALAQLVKASDANVKLPCMCAKAKAASPKCPDSQISSSSLAPLRLIAWPVGTSPIICMLMVSGPRVVSPPIKSTLNTSAQVKKPRENSVSHG